MGKNGGKGCFGGREGWKVVEELQGKVGMLGVETIEVEEGRRKVFHGEQKAAAVEITRSSSGSRCSALGDQLMCRGASRV
jgi:hypothetical protein